MGEPEYGEPWEWAGCDVSCDEHRDYDHDETNTLRLQSEKGCILRADTFGGAAYPLIDNDDQDRIVACVNALAGMNPEAVGELLRVAKVVSLKHRLIDGRWCVPATDLDNLLHAIAKAEGGQDAGV